MPFTKQVGCFATLFRHSNKKAFEKDGPIESIGDTDDARMDGLVTHAGSSDYTVNIVNGQAKTTQQLQEKIQVLQQNHATSQSGISKEVEGQYDSMKPTWDTRKETTLVNDATISAACSKNILTEHLEGMTQEATQKLKGKEVEGQYGSIETVSNTSKETTLVNHAVIPDACSEITAESSDVVTVKHAMQIQRLEAQLYVMNQKCQRLDQVAHQLKFDYQETLTMLSVAKDFIKCLIPTEASADAAISYFLEKDADMAQKIDHMRPLLSHIAPPNRGRDQSTEEAGKMRDAARNPGATS